MFKLMNFLVRKPGMSVADFRDYYENRHVPLSFRVFPELMEHRRNYPSDGGVMFPPGVNQPWDCIGEIFLASQRGFDDMMALLSDPVRSKEILSDGENFLDSSRCGMLVVGEERTVRSTF